MRKSFIETTEGVGQYVEKVFAPQDSLLDSVKKSTKEAGMPEIQVGTMDGLHLEILTRACGAKKIVEFGTLGGYSGICFLRGMGEGGHLYTLEKSAKHATVAKENFKKAGFTNVTILEGEALSTMLQLEKEGPFDLVFLDADKANYLNYFSWAEKHLRSGGVLLADNCFAFGNITREDFANDNEKKVVMDLREFNQTVAKHPHFRATMLPTKEGLLMAVRR